MSNQSVDPDEGNRSSLKQGLWPSSPEDRQYYLDLLKAVFGGGFGMIVSLAMLFWLGNLTGAEAVSLLRASQPTMRFLSSAVMTSTASILALMLTLLSLSANTNITLKAIHYRRVKLIAQVDTITFILTTFFLLMLIVPLDETKKIPATWYETIYYSSIMISSMLCGFLVAIVLMLYETVRGMVDVVGTHKTNYRWVAQEDD